VDGEPLFSGKVVVQTLGWQDVAVPHHADLVSKPLLLDFEKDSMQCNFIICGGNKGYYHVLKHMFDLRFSFFLPN